MFAFNSTMGYREIKANCDRNGRQSKWIARTGIVLFALIGAVGCGSPLDSDRRGGPAAEDAKTTTEALQGGVQGFAWVTGGVVGSGYSYNSTGGAITVAYQSTGYYIVTFANMAGALNAQVVSYGGGNNADCRAGWPSDNNAGGEQVPVWCNAPSGARTDSDFVVQVVRNGSTSGSGAYLRVLVGNSPPTFVDSFNSTGATNQVQRVSAGTYTVTLPGLAVYGGSVQLTGFVFRCKVVSWYPSGSDEIVNVKCFNRSGVPTDDGFSLNFFANHTASAWGDGAYAWANNSTASSYTPSLTYSYDSGSTSCAAGTNSAGSYGTGQYFMLHSALNPANSAAIVTAYGSDSSYCNVAGWYGYGDGTEVDVQCFNSSGSPTNTLYVETYSTSFFLGPC